MSIVNAWIAHDRALVGVDSEIEIRGNGYVEGAKLHALPHLNALIVGRGSYLFHLAFYTGACALCAASFDELEAQMLHLANAVFAGLPAGPAVSESGADMRQLDFQSVLLIGWSPRRGAFFGTEVEQTCEGKFRTLNAGRRYAAPWHHSLNRYPPPTTPDAMATIAALQVTLIHEQVPHAAAGGRFICAELTRGAMTVKDVCALPARPIVENPIQTSALPAIRGAGVELINVLG